MEANKFYTKDSFEEYLGKKDHLSSSLLKKLLCSPKHYQAALDKVDEDEKEHLVLGSAIHCKILEPEAFDKSFFHLTKEMLPYPDKDFRTAANREKRDDLKAIAKLEGKLVLEDKHIEKLIPMEKSIRSNKTAMDLLQGTIREASFYTEIKVDPETSIKVRVRPDAINLDKKYYISLKSTTDASPSGFSRQAHAFGYHVSESFYFRTLHKALPPEHRPETGYIIAIENKEPFVCQVYSINEPNEEKEGEMSDFLQVGFHYMNMGLLRLREMRETGEIKGYDIESEREDGILPIKLPAFAMYDANTKII